ncbi:hypothetical protein [Elizabethkingia ursingii]|uniref:hypothetical protein n=1 Tax=Elizabethkingia ursingii TaxID=1756150 RepID=UPI00105584A6|nr:hypothetical protein [Elizabethkingia ursingii]
MFPYISKELKRVGVTHYLLWEEYIEKHPSGYRYSRFCHHYREWCKKVNPSMHIEHKRQGINFSGIIQEKSFTHVV